MELRWGLTMEPWLDWQWGSLMAPWRDQQSAQLMVVWLEMQREAVLAPLKAATRGQPWADSLERMTENMKDWYSG